jgi:molybdopterin synthase catalytic subunit
MIRSALVTATIDVPSVISEVMRRHYGANDGRSVSGIEYSAYESMAEMELERICGEAAERFGVDSIVVEHRLGLLAVGEASIVICAAHKHRAAAQNCTSYIIEEVKKRLPVWKLEHYADGTREWVDPTRSQTSVTA